MQKGFAPIIILVGIVLAVAIIGGTYYIVKSKPQNPPINSVIPTSPPQQISPSKSPIPINSSVRLKDHTLKALSQATKIPSSPSDANQVLTLTITLNRTNQAGFDVFLSSLQDPNSPNFRHFLSQGELADRFGPSQQAYDAVLTFMQQNDFKLVEGSKNRLTLTVSGTREQVEKTFDIHINNYQLNNRTFFANDNDPSVPTNIASYIEAVTGLANLAVAIPANSSIAK